MSKVCCEAWIFQSSGTPFYTLYVCDFLIHRHWLPNILTGNCHNSASVLPPSIDLYVIQNVLARNKSHGTKTHHPIDVEIYLIVCVILLLQYWNVQLHSHDVTIWFS